MKFISNNINFHYVVMLFAEINRCSVSYYDSACC